MKSINYNFIKSTKILLLTLAMLTACEQPTHQNTTPIEITRNTACSLDDMILADYPGPKAQIQYANQTQPEYFCDLIELFNVILKPEQSRKINAIYVQDMGSTQWEEPKGQWIDARTAFYVIGSKKMGSMGPTFGSFAQEKSAKEFLNMYGGKIYKFDEITADMATLDGGALHDQHM